MAATRATRNLSKQYSPTEGNDMNHTPHDDDQTISVADHRLGKTRVLSRQCDTCVFRPGNPMHLPPGRLADLVDQARTNEGYIVCHDTLPYSAHPHYGPAVCRGFFDRYDTQALRLARRLWGIVEVPPPSTTTEQPARPDPEPAATSTAPGPHQPLVFVDVDGVLNPAGSNPDRHGYRPHRFASPEAGDEADYTMLVYDRLR
jgi:hypothetical protein